MYATGIFSLFLYLISATGAYAQNKASCEDQLAVIEKQLLIVVSDRNQAQQSLATVWVRAERAEQELIKLKKGETLQPSTPTKDAN